MSTEVELMATPEIAAAEVGYSAAYVRELVQRGWVEGRTSKINDGSGVQRVRVLVSMRSLRDYATSGAEERRRNSHPLRVDLEKPKYMLIWVACPSCGQSMRLQIKTWRCWCGRELADEVGRYAGPKS